MLRPTRPPGRLAPAEQVSASSEPETDAQTECVSEHERATMVQYCASIAVQVAEHLEGIAAARATKPRKATERDGRIPEHLVYTVGGHDDDEADNATEEGILKHQCSDIDFEQADLPHAFHLANEDLRIF